MRAEPRAARPLWLSLAIVVDVVVLVIAAGATAIAYSRAYTDAQQLQDDVLREVVSAVGEAPQEPVRLGAPGHGENASAAVDIVIQTIGRADAQDAGPDLPAGLADGLRTLEIDGQEQRVMIRTLPDGSRIGAFQPVRARDELAQDTALSTAAPLLTTLPVIALLLALAIRLSLRPMRRLAGDLAAREAGDLRPLPVQDAPRELQDFLRSLNDLLERASGVLEDQRLFAAEAAHELRTPITALSLQAESVASASTDEQRQRRLEALRAGSARASELCDQLLALASAQHPDASCGSLASVVGAAVIDVVVEADARGVEIITDLDGLAERCVPSEALRSALRNLLVNAVRHGREGGQVHIDARGRDCGHDGDARAGAALTITVEDDGPGISDPEAVLRPFHREAGQSTPGNGLGLAITVRALETVGGRLRLEPAARHRTGLAAHIDLPG